MQNYKKQFKGAIQKLPGDLAHFSDEKIFFLSLGVVNLNLNLNLNKII